MRQDDLSAGLSTTECQQTGVCTFRYSGAVVGIVDGISSGLELGTYSWPGSFFLAAYLDRECSRVKGTALDSVSRGAGSETALAAAAFEVANPTLKLYTGMPQHLERTRVVELGAGTGLPSLLLSKLGAASVTLTDDSKRPAVLRACAANCTLNATNGNVRGLDWADFRDVMALCSDSTVLGDGSQDLLLLGADVFWLEERFEDLISCVAHLLRVHRKRGRALDNARSRQSFLTAFHLRDASLSIAPLLERYGLRAVVVATAAELELPIYQRITGLRDQAEAVDGLAVKARAAGKIEVSDSMMFMKASSQDSPVVIFEIVLADGAERSSG